jgi:hypothetical protein
MIASFFGKKNEIVSKRKEN